MTEGKVTEPQYVDGFCRHNKLQLVHVETFGIGATPQKVVDEAMERKTAAEQEAKTQDDPFVAYDSVWCVFDVDQHQGIANAFDSAKAYDIKIAVSNPCFEVWLILHFQDSGSPSSSNEAKTKLGQILKRNHKCDYTKQVNFSQHYAAGYPGAVERAQIQAKQAGEVRYPPHPYTGVFELTEEILKSNKSVS